MGEFKLSKNGSFYQLQYLIRHIDNKSLEGCERLQKKIDKQHFYQYFSNVSK